MCVICVKGVKSILASVRRSGPHHDVFKTIEYFLDHMPKCPAMRALENCTALGSEFVNDPAFCEAHIRDKQQSMMNQIVKRQKTINTLEGQLQGIRTQLLSLFGMASAFDLIDRSLTVDVEMLKAAKETGTMIYEGLHELISRIPKEGQ